MRPPRVFRREGDGLRLLLGADPINDCATLEDLERLILRASAAEDDS